MLTLKISFALAIGVASLSTSFAGPSTGYLCHSDDPFDRFSLVRDKYGSVIYFQLAKGEDLIHLHGDVPAGQSPYMKSRQGMIIVPLVINDKPVVDIYFRKQRVTRLPGRLQDADVEGKSGQTALVSTSEDAGSIGETAKVTQSVVAADGRIVASRRFKMSLNEDGAQQFRLTTAGDGIYRLPSENLPLRALEVLDPRSFQTRMSVQSPDLEFTDLVMKTALDGFAVGNGQLYRIRSGKIYSMTNPHEGFRASKLTFDWRSDRLLVEGPQGFLVFDGDGRKLLGQRGMAAVRLTVEGDVVEYKGKQQLGQIWSRKNGYATPIPVSFESIPNWNSIACMTSHSAAVSGLGSGGGKSRLIRYRN